MATIGPLYPAAGADDWQNGGGNRSFYGTGSTIYFGRYSSDYEFAGVRFALSAAIPSGSTINSATLALFGAWATDVNDCWFYVVDSADAGQITTDAARPSWNGGSTNTLPNTDEGTGAVHYTTAWNGTGTNSIPVGPLIQALVDKYGGLANGAHVHIVFCGDGAEGANDESNFYGYEETSNLPALTIVYTAGETPSGGTMEPGALRGVRRGMLRGEFQRLN